MAKLIDLSGLTFHNLTVLERDSYQTGETKWICLCTCGKSISVFANNLKRGHTKSCGCLFKSIEMGVCADGLRSHPLYQVWKTMIYRCYKPKRKEYKNYGGRGIKVCDRWLIFENFITDMYPTYQTGLELDREINDGNYEFNNCKWVTGTINKRKTRRTKLTQEHADNIRTSLKSPLELSKIYNCSRDSIYDVINNITWV